MWEKSKIAYGEKNKMKPLVSIIVPVFRTERYLEECVESLVNQTYDNCEIILIDDGSDDESPQMCDRLHKKYENVVVVHQENKGPSAARNAGLKEANGKYIGFCDSDDRYKAQTVETLVNAACKNRADVVIFGYETFPNGKTTMPAFPLNRSLTCQQLIESCPTIHSGNEFCFTWRFFASKELVDQKKLKFNEDISFGEDVIFNINLVANASRILVLGECLYEYRTDNPTSIMRTKYKENLTQKVSVQYREKIRLSNLYGFNNNQDWMEDLAYYNITGFAGMLFRNAMNGPKEKRYAEIKNALKLPILADSYATCGRRLYQDGKKHTIFRLACRYHIMPAVLYFVKKWYL